MLFGGDFHFNHSKVIGYCKRPFKDKEEMNETLITSWNMKADPNSIIYINGDLVFCKHNDGFVHYLLSTLKGKIKLIPGDHDRDLIKFLRRNPKFRSKIDIMDSVCRVKWEKQNIVLWHWCMRVWPKSHYNSWHLYAHSHGSLPSIGKSHDIGIDNNNYQLLWFEEIVELMKNKPDNPNLIKKERR